MPFTISGWNWGGVATDLGPTALAAVDPGLPSPLGLTAVQEVRRSSVGWSTEQIGKWVLLSHQVESEWRGTGVIYDPASFAVMRRLYSTKGTWFRFRHLTTKKELWMGSLYLAPSLNTLDMQGYLIEHLDRLPATTLPVYFSGDTNAPLQWSLEQGDIFPHGSDSKARTLIDTLTCYGYSLVPPEEGQRLQPTSRPRRDDVEGRIIDWIATKHTSMLQHRVCGDSSKELGTDHDCLRVSTGIMGQKDAKPRIVSGPRVIKSSPELTDHLDQHILRALAAEHTQRPSVARFRDDNVTKVYFRVAKKSKKAADWKRALRSRQKLYQEWKEKRITEAVAGNWQLLKDCRPTPHKGWESKLAESLHPSDPHEALHAHYQSVFHSGATIEQRSRSPPRSQDITDSELEFALNQGRKRRSVGHDGVSLELLQAIANNPSGKRQLLHWYNTILHEGILPPDWLDSLMVLLPKVRAPEAAKDTRPIAIGCAAEKIYSRIILQRTRDHIALRRPWQCAGPRRQTCDYLYVLHKLFEEEREWSQGICVLKVDFRRAFDSVRRDKLLCRLFHFLGNTEEFRAWEALMTNTTFTLRSPWGQTTLSSDSGIRQGSVESPAFFGVLMEWVLEDIIQANGWKNSVTTYQDLELTQAAFMDDLILWDGTSKEIELKMEQLRSGFAEWGLHVHPAKCSLYVSPKHRGAPTIKAGDMILHASDSIEVMNVPFRVGANTQELLQRTWQRARDKFWSIRHLLMSSTPIGNRIRILDRVVGSAMLWNSSAFTPEHTALQAINQHLYQFVFWMLRLRKRPGEAWADFRKRGLRQARQLVCRNLKDRWSTQWLSRFWGFMGHVARGEDLPSPPCSSVICKHRPLAWWEEQQSTPHGVRHRGRFRAKMMDVEKRLDRAAGGAWRVMARDRVAWRKGADQWIVQNDVPWASGNQFAIEW